MIRQRAERIRLELPTVNQLLALHVRTGAGPMQAVQRVVARGHGVVVDELETALRRSRAGGRESDAFRSIALMTPEPSAARTYELFAVAVERGADLAEGLLALGDQLREARREEVRKQAVRRRAAMLLPTIGILAPIMLALHRRAAAVDRARSSLEPNREGPQMLQYLHVIYARIRRSEAGLATAELLGNAALGVAALVVIWAALRPWARHRRLDPRAGHGMSDAPRERRAARERGLVTIQYVFAVGISFVLLVLVANLLVDLYARAAVRDALEEGTRAAVPIDAAPSACADRARAVLHGLLRGPIGRDIRVHCDLALGVASRPPR